MFLEGKKEETLAAYEKLSGEFPDIFKETEEFLKETDQETAWAVRYFYTVMPLSDMANYSPRTFLDFARQGVFLWKNIPWVRNLPQDIFLNYVLHYRVNEEEILPCREAFWEQLEDRIQGKTILEAATEINYWCAEEATYRSGDERTLAAWTVYKRGYGRCGEESVFLVNALRSAGIPARQVYVPRWSHCDDNHAWVEFWCDGKWYFTGACEPFLVMNKGWFTNAASRAMLVHSRVFGENQQPEIPSGKEGMVQSFNQLERYALTKKLQVFVKDDRGRPVKGAKVRFQILNMAEYYSGAVLLTDEEGKTEFLTGLGTIYIYVNYKDLYCEGNVDVRDMESWTAVLRKREKELPPKEVDIIPPKDVPVNPDTSTREQKEEGKKRAALGDKLRKEKKEGWVNPEISRFLEKEPSTAFYRKAMLEVLSEKDLTDLRSEALEEHLAYALPYKDSVSQELFLSYILNPRVEFEILGKYREEISKSFTEEEICAFRENPLSLWEAVDRSVQEYPERERQSVITMPAACIRYGTGSRKSKEILFVAAARTFGICARYNPVYQTLEYWTGEAFAPVIQEEKRKAVLIVENKEKTLWKYFQNWSLGRLKDGEYVSLNLENVKWEGSLSIPLPEGQYRLITANRLPNGNIFALHKEFTLSEGEERREILHLREAKLEDMLECLALPEFFLEDSQGGLHSSKDITRNGKHILLWLEEGKEPTEHILNEILEQEKRFREYEKNIIFVIRSREALTNQTLAKVLEKFPDIGVYYDSFEENVELLGRRVYVDFEKLPLILVTKGESQAIYGTSGYNVGTGDMLLRLMGEDV